MSKIRKPMKAEYLEEYVSKDIFRIEPFNDPNGRRFLFRRNRDVAVLFTKSKTVGRIIAKLTKIKRWMESKP
jgi:hypothetical protein